MDGFLDLKLATVVNDDLGFGGTAGASDLLDRAYHVHSLHDGAKDDVLAIEPSSCGGAQKELASVGSRPGYVLR